ncbi:MAG: ATP-binding cassette domain-containing protein, partial [Lentisphaeria bacterium]|nr:ATP-binding cassette domain-containing protein [Lentisphaeria bacterium]
AYHAEEREIVRFHGINRRYTKQAIRAMRLHILVSPMMELVAVTATLVFLLYSYSRGVTVTELAALLAPAMMAYRPIKDVSKVFASIQQSMAAADRYFALLDTDTSLPEKENAAELTKFQDKISIRDISFSYADRKVVDHVTFDIPRGSMVAVVGETGSGKTTVANLLARFYDVDSGAITIDGVDLRDYSIASLRRMIGVVNQEAILFNDTIADNIAYGKPEATRDEIVAAAKLANAHDFIVSGNHPEGYDTEVGEKGFKLSGGEKQRVAIARAILCNPPILILDEATSALDTVTEKLVQEALNRVMTNRTVFAIAHRLSTIQNADMILVMQGGKIVEYGKEAELLAKNGIYSRLHDTQFKNR